MVPWFFIIQTSDLAFWGEEHNGQVEHGGCSDILAPIQLFTFRQSIQNNTVKNGIILVKTNVCGFYWVDLYLTFS